MLLRTTLTFFFTPVVKRKQDLGLCEYNLLENVFKNLICYWLFDLCSGYASGLIISFIDGLIEDYFFDESFQPAAPDHCALYGGQHVFPER